MKARSSTKRDVKKKKVGPWRKVEWFRKYWQEKERQLARATDMEDSSVLRTHGSEDCNFVPNP